jgi:hypothetical protein
MISAVCGITVQIVRRYYNDANATVVQCLAHASIDRLL